MAIKLDPEKAYDRISWDFIGVTLIAAGFSSFSKRLLWVLSVHRLCRSYGMKFRLSPSNPCGGLSRVVLYRLTISSFAWNGKWHSIQLSRSRSFLSHLFFADDLVIFGKEEMGQALLLNETFKSFYDLSGHKVSSMKSNMYFSKGVDDSLCDQISHFFGFQKVLNLESYLGVLLLHDRVTKSTLNFIVDKVRPRKLFFAGQVTLAQSVILAIPNYFMQSLLVSKRVCDEIEKITRQFIWGGSMGHPKNALVGWESICKPKSYRGFGLRHLHDQNNSFIMKIVFNLISQKDALWVHVLHSKYGWKNQLLDTIHRSNCSHLWRSLSKVWPLFCENLIWSIRDGSSI
ncbi:Retrovirus-related Pol polyprotein LINE-1 [Gossypium australe]|uniref:Retrovirus-related Pol polyprotein LINE-1 n=1 Tax=Gossypium australe TaxID=47621 RepID=A0A5B6XAM6_9ROSI|nr:Retrovirus-related Pol polyprotein LINE-1 [Gossypium australe]